MIRFTSAIGTTTTALLAPGKHGIYSAVIPNVRMAENGQHLSFPVTRLHGKCIDIAAIIHVNPSVYLTADGAALL